MTEHELKTWPEFYAAVDAGEKTYEIRKNDRDFRVGDVLVLRAWEPIVAEYLPELPPLRRLVTYMTHGGRFGLPDDMCVMAIAPAPKP